MFAVRRDDTCIIRDLETSNCNLILRPQNPAYPIETLALEDGQKPGDYIVGRVCYVGVET